MYIPPGLQARVDSGSGMLCAQEHDYKTAGSYFLEAFETYDTLGHSGSSGERSEDSSEGEVNRALSTLYKQKNIHPSAVHALKMMVLCKIMLGQTDDIHVFFSGKVALKYASVHVLFILPFGCIC